MKRALLLLVIACGGAPPPVKPLPLVPSAPIALDVTGAPIIAEQGDAVYVFAGKLATVLRGGGVAARAESPRAWTSAAVIAAPDGEGRWVVAADEDGVLWRVTLSGEREQVASRFGLGDAKVRAIGGAGTTTAFALDGAVAYTIDGVHLARVPADASTHFAVARNVLARATATQIEKWDLVHATRVTYPLAAEQLSFLDGDSDHPRLVAARGHQLFVESSGGKLEPHAAPVPLQELAARGKWLWLGSGGLLFLFDGSRFVPAKLADYHGFLLAATQTGDAWLATERGLVRYSPNALHDDPVWHAQVEPVFQRVCSHCHLPGGEADIDLSTPAAWASERAEITRRVLVTRTMPPAGTDLSDTDRAALAAWLER